MHKLGCTYEAKSLDDAVNMYVFFSSSTWQTDFTVGILCVLDNLLSCCAIAKCSFFLVDFKSTSLKGVNRYSMSACKHKDGSVVMLPCVSVFNNILDFAVLDEICNFI